MHPSRVWPTEDDARPAVEAQPVKVGVTVLPVGTHFAHADLVAHNFDRLLADQGISERRVHHRGGGPFSRLKL